MKFLVPHIFIPKNTPSSKNSKQIGFIYKGKGLTKKKIPTLRNSDLVTKYKQDTEILWKTYSKTFHRMVESLDKPYYLGLYFIRDSNRAYDFINAAQIICDLMQTYSWIENDDTKHITPIFLGTHVDKNEPGCYLCVIKKEDYNNLTNKYIQYE